MTQRFDNARNISSPTSHSGSFSQSTVMNTNNFSEPRQQYGSSNNLKYSQASYSTSNNKPSQFYTSQVNQTTNFYASNVSESSVRQFYKGLGSLPE